MKKGQGIISVPKYVIRHVAMGIAPQAVDREGGMYGAGLIRGYGVARRGEHKGWGEWSDDVYLRQIVDLGNARTTGMKGRDGHPSMSSDGMPAKVAWLRT